jgi:hypothetical protein
MVSWKQLTCLTDASHSALYSCIGTLKQLVRLGMTYSISQSAIIQGNKVVVKLEFARDKASLRPVG